MWPVKSNALEIEDHNHVEFTGWHRKRTLFCFGVLVKMCILFPCREKRCRITEHLHRHQWQWQEQTKPRIATAMYSHVSWNWVFFTGLYQSTVYLCIFWINLLSYPGYIWFNWWVRFFAYGIFWKSAVNLVDCTCQTNRLSRLNSLAIFIGILNWNSKMITQGWYLKQRSVNQGHQTTSMQAMCRYCSVILSIVYYSVCCDTWEYFPHIQSNSSEAQNVVYSWLMYAHEFEHRIAFPVRRLDPLDEVSSIYFCCKGCIPDWYKYDCSLEH